MKKLVLHNDHLYFVLEALAAQGASACCVHACDINEVEMGILLEGLAQLFDNDTFIFLSHDCNVLILDFVNSLGIDFDTTAHRT